MTENDQLEEQNKLLRAVVRLLLEQESEDKTEAEKAKYLADTGFTHQEIANILNKTKGTVSSQLSRLE